MRGSAAPTGSKLQAFDVQYGVSLAEQGRGHTVRVYSSRRIYETAVSAEFINTDSSNIESSSCLGSGAGFFYWECWKILLLDYCENCMALGMFAEN